MYIIVSLNSAFFLFIFQTIVTSVEYEDSMD